MQLSKFKIKRLTKKDFNIAANAAKIFYNNKVSNKRLKSFLSNPINYFLAAMIDGNVVGFVLGYHLNNWYKDTKEILLYDIEVLKQYRNFGIGTKLINSLKELAIKKGFDEIWAPSNESNQAAIELYKKNGGIQKHDDDILFTFKLKK